MTITNGNGDVAVYNSVPPLSTQDFEAVSISFYPNPVTNFLNINNNGLVVKKIEIFTLTGSIVFTTSEISEKINMSHLNEGLYLIKASTENGVMYHKIVKE